MSTLADLARWAADAPPGTLVPAEQLAELLEHLADTPAETATPATPWRVLLWLNDGSCIRLRPLHDNHVWSYDFVSTRTEDGRALKLLITTAAARQRPEVQMFREWILDEAGAAARVAPDSVPRHP